MKEEEDKFEMMERCIACGKGLKPGTGRFRKTDAVYCVKCYSMCDAYGCEKWKKSESAGVQDSVSRKEM